MKFLNFFLISLLVHLILFVSVFDIYFTSPIIHGMKQIDLPVQVPASRLVLFVADGLRADKFYELDEKGETRSPFLRNVVMNSGSWGVSHTRVPTESRPGHVALIAGFYEDVSAILKGWKENPIEFDSVFNKSRNTWAWGSPDILPMFARVFFSGENMSHVHIDCYRGDTQSFAGDDSSLLDEWVFDKVEKFFKLAETNKTLGGQLKEKNTVFFLHLLGIDTNGHSHYPMSKEYLDNIRKVDKGVEQVVDLFNQFYKDRKTAYVFTADHGMTDWGSHGAGLASETLTPLVVWGAGAEKHNDLQMPLNDESIKTTRDVNQADIAPLMSSLVGSPIPVNSVGELPIEYLSMDSKSKSQLLHGNAQQLSEQFIVKMESIKNKTFTFSPFPKLSHSEIIDMNRKVTAFINQEKYEVANELSRKLSKLSLEGMSYFHTYHRTILYISIVLSFIGWIVEAVLMLIHQVDFISSQAKKLEPLTPKQKFHVLSLLFAAGGIFTSLRIFVLDLPPSYHLYCTLPICIWYHIFTQRYTIQAGMMYILSKSFFVQKIALYTTVSVIAMLALVFSFFFRYILTVELLVFGVAIFKTPLPYKTKRYWATVCTFAAVFPMLPTVGRAPNSFLVFGGGLMGGILSYHLRSQKNNSVFSRLIPFLPFIAGCIQPVTMYISSNQGSVPTILHVLSWSLLALSWVLPLLTTTNTNGRLVAIFACHITVYILISLSYDAVFCVMFCMLLHCWIQVELQLEGNSISLEGFSFTKSPPSLSTIRIAYMFLFFIVLAFFGVGNIASINSFDVKVVLPFLTKFNHLVMGLLLAYKVLLPYLLVACTLCCIAVVSRTNLQQLCYAVVIVSDVMGMHFFFLVQDSGSWLDIGTSISHYVICMSMVLSNTDVNQITTVRCFSLNFSPSETVN
uniref:GPI ethanolamine phosphate transferase 1 n=1 Tax=Ciona savignyi TaxID=51511 RepID=H2Z1S6_CIOSA